MSEERQPVIEQEPASNVDQASNTKEEAVEILSWKQYFEANNMTTLLGKKWGVWTPILFIYYSLNFCCCVAACNFYSDVDRNTPCQLGDGVVVEGEAAAKVLDMAIYLLAIYHIAEWIRTTILLTVIVVGSNLLKVWYASAIFSVYGLCCFIYLHVVYASDWGMACGEV